MGKKGTGREKKRLLGGRGKGDAKGGGKRARKRRKKKSKRPNCP